MKDPLDRQPSKKGAAFMYELVRRHPRGLGRALFFALLSALLASPAPYLAKLIIDELIFRGVTPGSSPATGAFLGVSSTVWMIGAVVGFIVFLKIIGAFLGGWLSHYVLQITRNSLYELRLETALRLMGAPARYFESLESSRIASRLTHDINQMDGTIFGLLRGITTSAFTILTALGFMLAINAWLTVVILLTLPVTALATYFSWQAMKKFNSQESDRVASLASTVAEAFQGIKVLRAFNSESYFLSKIQDRSEALRSEGLKHWTVFHTIAGLIQMLSTLGGDIFLFVGGVLALRGEITFGDFFALYSYQNMLWGPVNNLLQLGGIMQAGAASAEKVAVLREIEQEPYLERGGRAPDTAFKGDIKATGLSFHYYEHEPILRDLNFEIKAGTMTALVGQSGSGKTTLASLLVGNYLPSGGHLRIDGLDLREWDLKSLRNHVGMVLQDPLMFQGDIRANVTLGKPCTDEEVWTALRLAHLSDFVESLPGGLDTQLGVGGSRLSGGQRQRIAIARVFFKNPKLLILDEATSALDTETEKAIQRSFDALTAGRTSIVIAHRLSTIFKAEQIFVLHQGRLVERGTHEELAEISGGYYRHLYEAQVEGMIPMSGATRRHR